MLDTTSTAFLTTRLPVTGEYLAKNKLTARARARLAADILDRRAEISELTVTPVARLCRVSVPTINAARRSPSDKLVKAWNEAGKSDRVQFAHRVGIARVWDDAIAAAID